MLTAIAGIFRRGKRDVLMEYIPFIMEHSQGNFLIRGFCLFYTVLF